MSARQAAAALCNPSRRARLLRTASLAAVVAVMVAAPAKAQLVRLRGGASAAPASGGGAGGSVELGRSAVMRQALVDQKATQQQASDIRAYIRLTRQAAAASGRPNPSDGLDRSTYATTVVNGVTTITETVTGTGLRPVASIRAAMQAVVEGRIKGPGGSEELLIAARAANDPTGKAVWDGANLPTTDSTNTKVEVEQTQARALLSWDRFDIGANTTLNFKQQVNGVAQPGWIAVNRVVDATGASTILGKLTADGQVYILNSQGVIFGKGASVNLRALVASSLELGNYLRPANAGDPPGFNNVVATFRDRTISFLQNGPTNGATLLSIQADPALFVKINGTQEGLTALPKLEGGIIVDPGASITTTGSGGAIILAAPSVRNDGILSATEGQVSLIGGRQVSFVKETGEATSEDPNIRGLQLGVTPVFALTRQGNLAPDANPAGMVVNTGLIQSTRGYLSLIADGLDTVNKKSGSVTNSGLLAATTSVSRNGKIEIAAGGVTFGGAADRANAGAISITPDETGETIPQGSDAEPASFKRSQVSITAGTVGIGQNALIYAPNAQVGLNVGALSIGEGATIDIGGLKDVSVDTARNFKTITPLKRNELRDTPNYREVAIGDNFSLNGTSLTVDLRRSGVRADGVAWIGSPLIEAGSIKSQVPVTVSELMTKGGDFLVSGGGATTAGTGSTIDISGGWVTYGGGTVATSKLVTADGRIVDIGNADPNDDFVSVYAGFTDTQPRFGVRDVYNNPIVAASTFEPGYDEGHDAGALAIGLSDFRGRIVGAAYAGERQVANALRPTASSTVSGDPRKLQANANQLPAGGSANFTGFGDIVIYHGAPGAVSSGSAQSLLNDNMLSSARLSSLNLSTPGAVTFGGADVAGLNLYLPRDNAGKIVKNAQGQDVTAGDLVTVTGASTLTLAPGGVLKVDAGRAIRVDGTINAPSGRVDLSNFVDSSGFKAGIDGSFARGGSRPDDDVLGLYASESAAPRHLFDITVNGRISTAGLWVNDYLGGDATLGTAWINGGSIGLTVAPNVFAAIGTSLATAQDAADLGGSIDINATIANKGVALDVSAGGYVRVDQTVNLTGRGGNVALVNATQYARTGGTVRTLADGSVDGASPGAPLYGTNQTVGFTPLASVSPFSGTLVPSLVPTTPRSHVAFADGSISAFGFTGSGTFTLVSPDVSFGSDRGAATLGLSRTGAKPTHIGLDFFQTTGFGGLDVSSYRSKIFSKLFNNGTNFNSAFLDTTSFVVRSGETFDLNTWLYPVITARADVDQLLALGTGAELRSLGSVVDAAVPTADFDKVAANFTLGGLTELVVEKGGTITGAAKASITASKLINSGTIHLPGGSIRQLTTTNPGPNFDARLIAVRDLSEIFGSVDQQGRYSATARNLAGISYPIDGINTVLLTNEQLFSVARLSTSVPVGLNDNFVEFLGVADLGVGIDLKPSSVTDLSGTALFDPRARFLRDGATGATRQVLSGKLIDGGTIATASPISDDVLTGSPLRLQPRTLIAEAGAKIDISGTTAVLEQFVSTLGYVANQEWSNGGRIAGLAGGSLAGAFINAYGGYADDAGAFARDGSINTALAQPSATGGTIEWRQPTIGATDPGVRTDNRLFANRIAVQGFDTLIARNGIIFDGTFDLKLDKALIVTSNVTYSGELNPLDVSVISATSGTNATIRAPFMTFDSLAARAVDTIADAVRDRNPVARPASVSFVAQSPGIDFVGANYFDKSIGTLSFATSGDVRFIGVDARRKSGRLDALGKAKGSPSLNGTFVAYGNTLFDAGRVYATTGTGNLQAFVDGQGNKAVDSNFAGYRPFAVEINGPSKLTLGGSNIDRTTPLSAGSYLSLVAPEIELDGHLAAPFGRLDIGSNNAVTFTKTIVTNTFPFFETVVLVDRPATRSVVFGANSLTTVSGSDVTVGGVATKVPYGTTLDLKEYFFTPYSNTPLKLLPSNQFNIAGAKIDIAKGATLDLKGGGDLYAYEFVSGVGGSRDVLDRRNTDIFSSNAYSVTDGFGYQYADKRQVYAIIPKSAFNDKVAPFDPVYSADYTADGPIDLYGDKAGLTVTLDASSGVPAGEYVLLPAHYALLPGIEAYRLVENTGQAAPAAGAPLTLRDGSVVVGGTYGFAGSNLADSTRHAFTIQSQTTFKKSSRIETTLGTKSIADSEARAGRVRPQLPIDSARLILSPLTELKAAGFFDTAAGLDPDGTIIGRGFKVDIGGTDIVIAPELTNGVATVATPGKLTLFDTTLTRLNADSLLIGGVRSAENGNTRLTIGANTLTVLKNAVVSAPEIILGVANGSTASALTIADGATLKAIDTVVDPDATDYLVNGAGAIVRLANGPERLIKRSGDATTGSLTIGAATLSGSSLAIDTSRNFTLSDKAVLTTDNIALSGDTIAFDGKFITSALQTTLGTAKHLSLRSPGSITFANGIYSFGGDLTIDAPSLKAINPTKPTSPLNVVINAANLRWSNSTDVAINANVACLNTLCGRASTANANPIETLTLNTGEAAFGSGQIRTLGFGDAVTLNATRGVFYEGVGGLDTGIAKLTLNTPFIADRGQAADPRKQSVRPDFALTSNAGIAVTSATAGPQIAAIAGNRAPGSRLSFGVSAATATFANDTLDIAITNSTLLASAGVIDLRAERTLTLGGAATLAVPGYLKSFGDDLDRVTVAAAGGTLNLFAGSSGIPGSIFLPGSATLITDAGLTDTGGDTDAGSITINASSGSVAFAARLNPGVTGNRRGNFTFDSGVSSFELADFIRTSGHLFGGDVAIRSGAGDLVVDTALKASSVSLTADGGRVVVNNVVDTSGVDVRTAIAAGTMTLAEAAKARVNGGTIALYGRNGVEIAGAATPTVRLTTSTTGYADADSRSAKAGDVTIGVGDGLKAALIIGNGAEIDAGAARAQASVAYGQAHPNSGVDRNTGRFVAETAKAPNSLADTTVYRFVEADAGGTVTLRAPIDAANKVDIRIAGGNPFVGAYEVQVVGVKRYDLNALAGTPGVAAGAKAGDVILDPSANYTLANAYQGNVLSSDFVRGALVSIPHFIRNFTVTTADTTTSFSGYRLRPGIDLVATGAISLNSNWNLAAATIDETKAYNAGLLDRIDALGTWTDGYGLLTAGTPVYSVKTGAEAALLEGVTGTAYKGANFFYRTDGGIGDGFGRASGEAALFSFRARGDVTIARSINDGFFVFRDKSDRAYIDHQAGGGKHYYNPAIGLLTNPNTGAQTISLVTAERSGTEIGEAAPDGSGRSVSFSPLSAEANSPAALGTARDVLSGAPAGASLEFGELFPLLTGNRAMVSSDIGITAGSDAKLSANPAHFDATSAASVLVFDGVPNKNTGEAVRMEYRLSPTAATAVLFGNDLKLAAVTNAAGDVYPDYDIDTLARGGDYAAAGLDPNALITLNWGGPASGGNKFATDPRGANALTYFAGNRFLGPVASRTGVVAPLRQIVAFLSKNKAGFLSAVQSKSIPTAATPPFTAPNIVLGTVGPTGANPYSTAARAFVDTVVRTGTGGIAISAARDVDLRGSKSVTYKDDLGVTFTPAQINVGRQATVTPEQLGGAAIYSAGHRVAQLSNLAGWFANGTVGRIAKLSDGNFAPQIEFSGYGATPARFLDTAAVLARGGGDLMIAAGRDILGRTDGWSINKKFSLVDPLISTVTIPGAFGLPTEAWRAANGGNGVGFGILPHYFSSGVGALAGGDVRLAAGRDVNDLTVALDTSVTTETVNNTRALTTFGSGDLIASVGRDLIGGQFDVGSGQARFGVVRDVRTTSYVNLDGASFAVVPTFRLENATAALRDGGTIQNIAATGLGAGGTADLYSQITSLSATALGDVNFNNQTLTAPTLELASLGGSVKFVGGIGNPVTTLYPSAIGQLSILSAGNIGNFAVSMLDIDPSLLTESAFPSGVNVFDASITGATPFDYSFYFPGVNSNVNESIRRNAHNNNITHANDYQVARIFTDGSIDTTSISLAKAGSIIAANNIVDSFIVGQNVRASDQTRVVAGNDITATTKSATGTGSVTTLPFFGANGIYLGGPGTLNVQAGRDIGPFITSAIVPSGGQTYTYGGGILTVGNDYNPWLPDAGADLNVQFGVKPGIDYAGLRETYLNPQNFATLDGDLFIQVADLQKNLHPDRTRQTYAPILADWLRTNAPAAYAAIFGNFDVPVTATEKAAFEAAAYGKSQDLYDAFAKLDLKAQTPFLINQLYFNELKQPTLAASASFQQYIRGYRAVEALFPHRLGYTDNLAAYDRVAGTVTADHPDGSRLRKLDSNGQPRVADRVLTGNADLRFATFQTGRGGDINILGPGGDFLAGSVVRTSEQPSRRSTRFFPNGLQYQIEYGGIVPSGQTFTSIPLRYEGILTLRGGQVRYFSDGDFRLNQSRLFTISTGDITAWSSNGDLNAGQGPKTAANFPPVTVRFDLNGFGVVDTAGGISGAGIGAFKQSPGDANSSITLVAPVGEVDAGDAGVRASGDIFVAAARVANADNFSAGGAISGVPSGAAKAAPAVPTAAGSSLKANLAKTRDSGANNDRESIISVDILGFVGGDKCLDPLNVDPDCPK